MSKQHVFIALYAGDTIGEARILAASADAELVALVVERLLQAPLSSNPVQVAIEEGKRTALRLVGEEREEGKKE